MRRSRCDGGRIRRLEEKERGGGGSSREEERGIN